MLSSVFLFPADDLVGKPVADPVEVRFGGILETGPLAGSPFAGTIAFDPAIAPKERHAGHSVFDLGGTGALELTVDGRSMWASRAGLFARIADGRGNSFDFVTIHGESADGREFEIFLGAAGGTALDPLTLPEPAVLRAMVGRTVTVFHGGKASTGELNFAD